MDVSASAYLKVVYHDRVGDAVDVEVLLHEGQAGAGHADVHGELGGDGMEPEVQLGWREKSHIELETLTKTVWKCTEQNDLMWYPHPCRYSNKGALLIFDSSPPEMFHSGIYFHSTCFIKTLKGAGRTSGIHPAL